MRVVILALLSFSSTGCLAAVVLPEVDITPTVSVSTDDVRAFRVEKTRISGFWGTLGSSWFDNYDDSIALFPIRIENKQIASQVSAKTYYWIALILAGVKESHDLEVILYRPGYEAIVIDSLPWWFPPGYILPRETEWKSTPNLAAQQKTFEEVAKHYSSSQANPEIQSFLDRERQRLAELEERAKLTAHDGR